MTHRLIAALKRLCASAIAQRLRMPDNTFTGSLIVAHMSRRNRELERLAVEHVDIQPEHR